VDVAEVGNTREARLGAVEPVGVEQDEALDHHGPRALGVGQVWCAEQLADLGQRLVEATERGQDAHRQVTPAAAGAGELAAGLPRRGGDAIALGGPLEVLAGVGCRGALGEHLVGPGVGPALAVAELGERLLGDARRLVAAAVGEAGPRRLDRHPPP